MTILPLSRGFGAATTDSAFTRNQRTTVAAIIQSHEETARNILDVALTVEYLSTAF